MDSRKWVGWMGWMRGAVFAAALAMALPAGALTVTSGFTGSWYDPVENGSGLLFEVIEVQGQTQVLVLWFLFDEQGDFLWLFGQAPVDGETVTVPMFFHVGGSFGEPITGTEQWGEITLTFNSCNSARLEFAEAAQGKAEQVGTGFKNLQRLTKIKGSDCTGGASDDLPPRVPAQDFLITLSATDAAPGATGTLGLEVRPGRMELKLKVRGLAVGTYDVTLDGVPVSDIRVVADDSGNEGELELESPAGPGDRLLDFDPRGKTIAVEQDGTVFLTTDVDDAGVVPGPGDGNPPPFGNTEIEVLLTNAGVYPLGKAEVELEQEPDRVDFKVELEDIPAGSYGLFVGGESRGTIQVASLAGRTEGEIEFRYPPDPGKVTLDFDPRGQEITIREGANEIFFGQLLNGGNGVGDNDNGGGDGDDDSGDDSGAGAELEVSIDLTPTTAGGNADGEAEYRRRSDQVRFKVEIEDVADGAYLLEVGGTPRGTIQVNGGEGELEFRNPVEPGKEPLDFDPLGRSVRVLDGGTVILQGTMPTSG